MDIPGSLINDHLNGELSADGYIQLGVWLRERDSHVREFAVQWLIHSSLYDVISQCKFQAEALFRATSTKGDLPNARLAGRADSSRPTNESTTIGMDDAVPGQPIRSRAGRLRFALVGLAALLLIGVMVGTRTYLAARPRVVAMLGQTANCQWDQSEGRLIDGALLKTGDVLRLTKGRALVTFTSGARTVLEGPATFTIQSEMVAALNRGAATTHVPTQAVGFTINMPRGRLVDLGTEFALRIRPDDSFEVQVFEGLVELRLIDEKHPVDDSPLRIARGVAVKVAAGSREAKSIPYDAGQRMTMP